MSLGVSKGSFALSNAVNAAYNAGVLMVAAAGASIYSTMPTYPTNMITASPQYYSQNYSYMSGTSMSTPYVTGAAALLSGANPGLRGAALRSRLDSTAQDLGVTRRDSIYGYGLVDAERAVMGTTTGNSYAAGDRAEMTVAVTSGPDGSYTMGNMPMETCYLFTCRAGGYFTRSQTVTMPLNKLAVVNFHLSR